MPTQNQLENKKITERNYSLDFLRIIAMLMIVTLHSGSHGGILYISKGINLYSICFWFIEALCVVSVNVYVLISGYFLINEKFRLSKVFRLIIETLFYSVLIWFLMIIKGDFEVVSIKTLISFLPISLGNYWFISAYIGMYLISPIINHLIKHMTQKKHLVTIVFLLTLTSLWSSIVPTADVFRVNGGYSIVWFVVLYLVAAYIRKYVDCSKAKLSIWIYLGCSTVILISWIVLSGIVLKIQMLSEYSLESYYYRYNSIFVFISSVALFLSIKRMNIKNNFVIKMIKLIAPLTLGVYLIHDNPNMRIVLWHELIKMDALPVNWLLPIKVIGIVLIVFISCLGIDFVRSLLFRIFESRKWYKNLLGRIDDIPYLIYDKITKRIEEEK